jgi:superfamily II DNA or RNA helicase
LESTRADIRVFKIDESRVNIETNPRINEELRDYFSAYADNYKFMPAVKSGNWDGKIRFYSRNELPMGLAIEDLEVFAKGGNYTTYYDFDPEPAEIDENEWREFVKLLKIPMEIRDYQIDAARYSLTQQKQCIKLPTGSGKSLVMYLICRWMQLQDKKVLVIVPRQSLVEQLYSDFIDYGWDSIWNNVHKIYSGKEKTYTKPVIVTTWQSMTAKTPKEIYEIFDCLLIDECHGASAKSIQDIAKKCSNAEWRIGLSGTYHDNKANQMSVTGALGPLKIYADYQKLKKAGYLAELNIKNLILQYPRELRRINFETNKMEWNKEVNFLNTLEARNVFLTKLAKNLKNNTFILFTKRDHGAELVRLLRGSGKRVYYIDGTVKVEEREKIRKSLEIQNDIVLVASFGTFKMGVNVKNVHNVIFASNYKSKITVVQSIGRGLRALEGKKEVVIFDIVDNLTHQYIENEIKKTYFNHAMRQYGVRKKIYKKEGFDKISQTTITLGG